MLIIFILLIESLPTPMLYSGERYQLHNFFETPAYLRFQPTLMPSQVPALK